MIVPYGYLPVSKYVSRIQVLDSSEPKGILGILGNLNYPVYTWFVEEASWFCFEKFAVESVSKFFSFFFLEILIFHSLLKGIL